MGEAPEAERLDVIHHIPLLMLWHSYLRQDISACFPEAFATHRCPFRSTVKALPATIPSNPGSVSIDQTNSEFNLETLSLDYRL